MLVRVTLIEYVPEHLEEALAGFEARVAEIAAEEGCRGIVFGRTPDQPLSASAISLWTDAAAHAAHEQTSGYARFAERVIAGRWTNGIPRTHTYEVGAGYGALAQVMTSG